MGIQETAALDLEHAAAELSGFIRECPEARWTKPTPRDGRSVGSLAYHCAAGNDVALGWICEMLAGRPVHETADTHNAANDAEAARAAQLTKADVLESLERTTARTAAFLRALTDEELQRTSLFGISGREVSVGRFVANFGRHILGHLEALQEVE